MAIGIGGVVPKLAETSVSWPYAVVGVGYALYGVALIAFGTMRGRRVGEALDSGDRVPDHGRILVSLAVVGGILALATAVLIVVS